MAIIRLYQFFEIWNLLIFYSYDVVFKFLMADMPIAKLILPKILNQEINPLKFNLTEFRKKIVLNLTVFLIEFSAVLRQEY